MESSNQLGLFLTPIGYKLAPLLIKPVISKLHGMGVIKAANKHATRAFTRIKG